MNFTVATDSAGVALAMNTYQLAAQIRYTLDGTEPTENSLKYTQPVRVAASSTVKALAFKMVNLRER